MLNTLRQPVESYEPTELSAQIIKFVRDAYRTREQREDWVPVPYRAVVTLPVPEEGDILVVPNVMSLVTVPIYLPVEPQMGGDRKNKIGAARVEYRDHQLTVELETNPYWGAPGHVYLLFGNIYGFESLNPDPEPEEVPDLTENDGEYFTPLPNDLDEDWES